MVFKRFVEVGRVVIFQDGENAGLPAVIVDIVDHNRVLVDGPLSGVKRQIVSHKHLSLTGIMAKVPRTARTGTLRKILEASKVMEKFNATAAATEIASRKRRAALNDFERFKVMKRAILTNGVRK